MKKLTKKEIQRINDATGKGDKVVDVCMITEDFGYTIEISSHHSVWKCYYRYNPAEDRWDFDDCLMLA